MSSRRKSKPVRRLDCSLNSNHHDVTSTDDNSLNVSEPVANGLRFESESAKNLEHLPEGVYVVQPQSASDDEEQDCAFVQDNGNFYVGNSAQKRISNRRMSEDKLEEGLDLSVKRRKTEINANDAILSEEAGGEHQTEIEKYLKLMSTQRRLLENAPSRSGHVNQERSNGLSWTQEKEDQPYRPTLGVMMASLAADDDSDVPTDTNRSKQPCSHKITSLKPGQESPNHSSDNQYSEASPIDSITAGTVSSGVGKSIKKGTLDPTNFDEDVFDQYITRYSLTNPCNQKLCPYLTKEHYHCTDSDCNFQRFTSKSDVIRHYNMHKKRDNSLAHGFMRFSPSDDCVPQFGACHLNGTSTHYHCLHKNCTKTYTSTSDVLAHDNFHKRNVGLVTNGFRRYRATELCDDERCVFRDQRTTHFHCTRKGCSFSFKNKCDMDKHKIYHVRDDGYVRQGFKKFFKSESCGFPSCPWNRTANHFHCLRNNCNFSFTSTSQIVSHKRKHDRQEAAVCSSVTVPVASRQDDSKKDDLDRRSTSYLSFGSLGQSSLDVNINSLRTAVSSSSPVPEVATEQLRMEKPLTLTRPPPPSYDNTSASSPQQSSPYESLTIKPDRINFTIESASSRAQANSNFVRNSSGKSDGKFVLATPSSTFEAKTSTSVSRFFRKYHSGECVLPDCVFLDRLHHHCTVQDCCAAFVDSNLVAEHSAFHEKLEKLGISLPDSDCFQTPTSSIPLNHHVLNVTSSSPLPPGFIALTSKSIPTVFSKPTSENRPVSNHVISDLKKTEPIRDSPIVFHQKMDPRAVTNKSKTVVKREIYSHSAAVSSEVEPTLSGAVTQQTQSSFIQRLLPLNSFQTSLKKVVSDVDVKSQVQKQPKSQQPTSDGYVHIKAGTACFQIDCKYMMQSHWHCTLNRCRYVCKSLAKAQSHLQAHDTLEAYARAAKDCFKSYSMKKNCPNPNCEFRHRGHYHCLKPGCQFVTIGTSKLPWHMKKHEKIAKREANGFKYYTKKERCAVADCKYSGVYSHYHCVRDGCTFGFQYKHQMSTHVRKHLRKMLGRSYCIFNSPDDIIDSSSANVNLNNSGSQLSEKPNSSDINQDEQLELDYGSDDLTPNQNLLLQQVSKGFTPIGDRNHSSRGETAGDVEPQDGDFGLVIDEDASSDNEALDFSLNNADLSDSNSDQSNEPDCTDPVAAELVHSSSNDDVRSVASQPQGEHRTFHVTSSHEELETFPQKNLQTIKESDNSLQNAQVNFSFITQSLSASRPAASSSSPISALSVSVGAPQPSDQPDGGPIQPRPSSLSGVALPES